MTDIRRPLIALIHATPAAIAPAREAFAETFPEAQVWNLLDDRLLHEANAAGGLTADLHARMGRLIEHAVAEGASGVLLTCSMYGPVATGAAAESPIPVCAADEAAFAAALEQQGRRLLVVASLPTALEDTLERFTAFATERGASPHVRGLVAEGAMAATGSDPEALAQCLVRAVRTAEPDVEAVLLAQYSLAPAAAILAQELGVPVLSGPGLAAHHLRQALSIGAQS